MYRKILGHILKNDKTVIGIGQNLSCTHAGFLTPYLF